MRAIEMGVGNHDRRQTAEGVDGGYEGGREKSDAVPEDVAVGCLDEEGALADGEAGGGVDYGEGGGGGVGCEG